MRFREKVILVVGASSGIGKATAMRMAAEGAMIVAVGRDMIRLKNTLAELPGEGHHAIVADVADEKQLAEVVRFGKENGGYSGGVFCTGLHEVRPLPLLKDEQLMAAFQMNVATVIHCTKALSKAVHPTGAGIVWLSSVAALRGTAGFMAYAAAKGALISAAKVAAVELVKKRIRVNVLVAGVVNTPMSEGWLSLLSEEQRQEISDNHLLGIGNPKDVGDAATFLVSTDARWITGTTLVVDGGLSIQ